MKIVVDNARNAPILAITLKNDTRKASIQEAVEAVLSERRREFARKGAIALNKSLTAKQRSANARKAARTRWGNRR